MSLAVLSIFTSTALVGAQEAEEAVEEIVSEEAVLSEDAELMAIKEVTVGIMVYECDTSAKTATLIAINETTSTKGITIPAEVNGCKVTAIADGVGSGLEKSAYITFYEATNLIEIGENCFSYCSSVHTVTLPPTSKIKSIGNNAFYYCPKLATINNLDVQTKLTNVGSSVFGLTPFMENKTSEFVMFGNVLVKYNGTDTEVTVPSGTKAIADAFFGKDITSIDLGDDLVTVGNNAFYGCRSLESITLPATCTTVGDMAFAGCTSLKTVEYAGGLTSIGFCSFANCPELKTFKNTSSKASNLKTIGECAFWNDVRLYYLDVGEIKNVNVGSFWNCFGQTPDEIGDIYYYRIPNTVKTIAEGGYGNLEFAYVTVPNDLTAIASTAFGSTSAPATYVVTKGSIGNSFFSDSGYRYIFYGDMNANGKIEYNDIKTLAKYLAQGINDLNYHYGKGVIADGDNDGNITMKDLNDVFRSIKEDVEAEQATAE